MLRTAETKDIEILQGYYSRLFKVVDIIKKIKAGEVKLQINLKVPIEEIRDYQAPTKEEIGSFKSPKGQKVFWVMKSLEAESFLDSLIGREHRPGRTNEVEGILANLRTDLS